MGFIIKSFFWVGIVILFLPRDPAELKAPVTAANRVAAHPAKALVALASAGAGFCQTRPEVCESAMLTTAASRDILSGTAKTIAAKLAKKPEPDPAP